MLARGRSFDHLAVLEGTSRRPATPTGPAPSRRVPCDCSSLIRQPFHDVERCEKLRYELRGIPSCPSCQGTGWRNRDVGIDGRLYANGQLIEQHGRDERGVTYDEFTYGHSLAVATKRVRELGEQTRQTFTERQLGQELDRIATMWPSLAGPEDQARLEAKDRYGWERARDRYLDSGSFLELERALDELHMRDEMLHRLFIHVHCDLAYGDPPRITGLAHLQIQAALEILDLLMPEPIRLPMEMEQRLVASRRATSVADVYRQTGSLTKTARRCGITRTKARETIRRAGLLTA